MMMNVMVNVPHEERQPVGQEASVAATAMSPASTAALVEAAQRGDAEAFDALVERYARYVVTLATQRLQDRVEAEDIAQETFLEVYRCLPRLHTPAAFGSWLRLITLKQVDRALRSQRLKPTSLDEIPGALDVAGDEEDIAARVVRGEQARLAHLALARLPHGTRDVVELFYLGGHSHGQVAAALRLPVSTVKKRLHDGRMRLRREVAALTGAARDSASASEVSSSNPGSPGLLTRIAFFTAVHDGSVTHAERLLCQHPTLIEAREDWTDTLASLYHLGLPSKALPLHQAAALGHLALVRCLLRHGATLDTAIGSGQTALHLATLSGRGAVVDLLLRAGADPACHTAAGLTPLHWAAMRGDERCARLLLAAGAPAEARDTSGRTPADWARIRGQRQVAALTAAPSGG